MFILLSKQHSKGNCKEREGKKNPLYLTFCYIIGSSVSGNSNTTWSVENGLINIPCDTSCLVRRLRGLMLRVWEPLQDSLIYIWWRYARTWGIPTVWNLHVIELEGLSLRNYSLVLFFSTGFFQVTAKEDLFKLASLFLLLQSMNHFD